MDSTTLAKTSLAKRREAFCNGAEVIGISLDLIVLWYTNIWKTINDNLRIRKVDLEFVPVSRRRNAQPAYVHLSRRRYRATSAASTAFTDFATNDNFEDQGQRNARTLAQLMGIEPP